MAWCCYIRKSISTSLLNFTITIFTRSSRSTIKPPQKFWTELLLSSPLLVLPHTHTNSLSFPSVNWESMAGKLMHAVHYTNCGGGPSDLKVTSISISLIFMFYKQFIRFSYEESKLSFISSLRFLFFFPLLSILL